MTKNYKVSWTKGGIVSTSDPMSYSEAIRAAEQLTRGARSVTILKENDGSDHPDNKGKWFLERIVK